MTRIIKIKNNTANPGNWTGQTIAAGEYHTLSNGSEYLWTEDSQVFTDVANGNLIVNDGTSDFTDKMLGWDYLAGGMRSALPQSEIGTKLWVHASSKPELPGKKFFIMWTSCGDDVVNHVCGAGTPMNIVTTVDQATSTHDVKFDSTFGKVFIQEGYAVWESAGWNTGTNQCDAISVHAIASATPVQTSANLHYEISNYKIKAAAGGPGTGTHGLAGTPTFVPSPTKTGYWDLNASLQPVYSSGQTGAYDWYTVDVTVNRFIHKVPIFGTSHEHVNLKSNDIAELPQGYFIRLTAHNNSNTVWKLAVALTLYRERTV